MAKQTDWKTWLENDLYPALFNYIPEAFPEHNFKPFSFGWKSNTYLNGSPHKRVDKTKVKEKMPGRIFEEGGENLSLVDYVMRRDNVDFIEAGKKLARIANIAFPKSNGFNEEEYQKNKQRQDIREVCNDYFKWCLQNAPGATATRDYVTNNRGFTLDQAEKMEFGFIPGQQKTFEYLQKKGYTQEQIDEAIKIKYGSYIGSENSLSIPYRSGGKIRGFTFRGLTDGKYKYLYTQDLEKGEGFFNMPARLMGNKLIVVEGLICALHCELKGINNVVAAAGNEVSYQQIKDAIRRGAKQFVICFDTEPDKEEMTIKKVTGFIDKLLSEGITKIYVTRLEGLEGKIDPDRLIKERGVQFFKSFIEFPVEYYRYWTYILLKKYKSLADTHGGGVSAPEKDHLQEEAAELYLKIRNPVDRPAFKTGFLSDPFIKGIEVITEETLDLAINDIRKERTQQQQLSELQGAFSKAINGFSKDDTEALETLKTRISEIAAKDKAIEFELLRIPPTKQQIIEEVIATPESIKSGYNIAQQPIDFRPGALSFIVGPTGHGKTTFLINCAINILETYPDKRVTFFSYEEGSTSVLLSALNTYLNKGIDIDQEQLSGNNRKYIEEYFKTRSTEFIYKDLREYFVYKEKQFFEELVNTNRLNIRYTPEWDSDTLIEAIRYLHKADITEVIFIDYIQELDLPENKYKTYSRQGEMKQICKALVKVAVETGLPIILSAQFNREVKGPHEIHINNIREAADIDHAGDIIIGFWNNNYKPQIPMRGKDEEGIEERYYKKYGSGSSFYVSLLKNRKGIIGREDILPFNGNAGRIRNWVAHQVPIDEF
jgi:replicative DNA helicase